MGSHDSPAIAEVFRPHLGLGRRHPVAYRDHVVCRLDDTKILENITAVLAIATEKRDRTTLCIEIDGQYYARTMVPGYGKPNVVIMKHLSQDSVCAQFPHSHTYSMTHESSCPPPHVANHPGQPLTPTPPIITLYEYIFGWEYANMKDIDMYSKFFMSQCQWI